MTGALSDVLAEAVGVALSPIPVLAVVLLLLSDRGLPNAAAFLTGWALALTAAIGVVWALDLGTPDGNSRPVAAGQVLLGVLLLGAAAREWFVLRHRGEATEVPAWLRAVEHATPPAALAAGLVAVVVNVKDVTLSVAAGAALADRAAPTGTAIAAIAAFVLVGSSTVILPVVVAAIAGEGREEVLHRWRRALERHGRLAVFLVAAVIGAVLLVAGLRVLAR